MKEFNTTAVCIPSKHYMVDLSDRVKEIKKLVDDGKYFAINRARQYGKTTTLTALRQGLLDEYIVLSLDFQKISNSGFATEEKFVQEFCRLIWNKRKVIDGISVDLLTTIEVWKDAEKPSTRLGELFDALTEWCETSDRRIVLIIDEVDSATNNQVFLDFLSQLRDGYISRDTDGVPAFQSVILAGVTDVKHLKSKIRTEDEHKVNSPWNIAADFDIDMSLSEVGIKGMLDEYEADHHTGMDAAEIAKSIRKYTNGYPYLVSRICELLDKKLVPDTFKTLAEAWTDYGVDEAVKKILSEESTLFESLIGKLTNYPELKGQLRRILLRGETIAHLPDDEEQKQLRMYGFIVNNHNTVAVANRIFEMRLYNYFIGESKVNEDLRQLAASDKSIFVDKDGWLDISKIMSHFIKEHNIIHKDDTEKFLEEEGRERFLTYLAPIINGTGTYSIEEQTRDHKRMDVVIHYLGRRYIIELKIWRGERYNADGEKQIVDYLDRFGLDTGYMLSFNFNKKKKQGVERVCIGDKILFEGTV
ncbi:MAG: AAA-like domain-containing protein [Oribacterium sp.]|nr:AAA-like domain-containing protein [Oribacterium sp.]MBO6310255.1 AAA-like domain-containing protein [Oribacterium sp.]MBP3802381.1 AAA-like domain-containing protein [Oribacterium sp.]